MKNMINLSLISLTLMCSLSSFAQDEACDESQINPASGICEYPADATATGETKESLFEIGGLVTSIERIGDQGRDCLIRMTSGGNQDEAVDYDCLISRNIAIGTNLKLKVFRLDGKFVADSLVK